jgi:chorismate mutase
MIFRAIFRPVRPPNLPEQTIFTDRQPPNRETCLRNVIRYCYGTYLSHGFANRPGFSAQGLPAMTACRGVRGATTVDRNDREEILTATRQLVALMVRRNGIDNRDVASAIFTTTPDLDAEFPALAARQLGWLDVPLLCGHEIAVPAGLQKCIRVLVHWNTDRPQAEIHHVYVRDAVRLRPDLCKLPPVNWDELEAWIGEQMGKHS